MTEERIKGDSQGTKREILKRFERQIEKTELFSSWKVPREAFLFASRLTCWKGNINFLLFLRKAAPPTPVLDLMVVLQGDLNKRCLGGIRCVISHALREAFLAHLGVVELR